MLAQFCDGSPTCQSSQALGCRSRRSVTIRAAMNSAASVLSASVTLSGPDSDCHRRLFLIVASPRRFARELALAE